jgi:hypothetical protein
VLILDLSLATLSADKWREMDQPCLEAVENASQFLVRHSPLNLEELSFLAGLRRIMIPPQEPSLLDGVLRALSEAGRVGVIDRYKQWLGVTDFELTFADRAHVQTSFMWVIAWSLNSCLPSEP